MNGENDLMKRCSKCDNEKEFSEFNFRKDTHKYTNQCRDCIKLINKEYPTINKEKIKTLYGEMTLENYGKIWCLDHCPAVASFNLLDENELKKDFNWDNLRPMYVKDNIIKGDNLDMRLYLLQEVNTKYFLRLKEEGLN